MNNLQTEKEKQKRCTFTICSPEHERLAEFLKKHGFAFAQPDESIVSVSLASLAKVAYFQNTQPTCRLASIAELPESLLRGLDRRLRLEAGALFDEALEKVPLDRECSMATMKDNEIDGCLLIEKRADNLLSLAYADSGSTETGNVFSSMLIAAYRTGLKKYPADTEILIQPVTPQASALVARLAPEAQALSREATLPLR